MSVLGVLEVTSIALGIRSADAMVKAAPVELVLSHPIDPGKYLTAVTGDVASVQASIHAGLRDAGPKTVVDHFVIANLHPQILPALRESGPAPERDAVGVLETRTAASIVEAADAACKAAPVQLITLHLALRVGGKGYTVFAGEVADVDAAIQAGGDSAGSDLIESVLIPNPYPELFERLLSRDRTWRSDGAE